MKPIKLLPLLLLAPAAAWATPDITVKAPTDTLRYVTVSIGDYIDGDYDTDEPEIALFTAGKVVIPDVTEPSYFISSVTPEGIFVLPGENITLTADKNGKVIATGSQIASAMLDYAAEGDSLQAILKNMNREDAGFNDIYTQWRTRADRRLPIYLNSPLGVYFLAKSTVQAENKYIDSLSASATESFLAPLYERERKTIDNYREVQANKERIVAGAVAPDITLPDMEGKPVALSSLRGKWVLLDFWGSWCRWCMVGVPQMKENYEKYKDVCEFVGIDCRESKEAWIAAVKANGLKWLQLYNEPADGGKPANVVYGVTGYPTKILINPEGRIEIVCVGEDPNFYDAFPTLMGK